MAVEGELQAAVGAVVDGVGHRLGDLLLRHVPGDVELDLLARQSDFRRGAGLAGLEAGDGDAGQVIGEFGQLTGAIALGYAGNGGGGDGARSGGGGRCAGHGVGGGLARGAGHLGPAQGAVQQVDAVEVGGLGDAVDLRLQGVHLGLQVLAVHIVLVGAVGGLGGQLHHAVEHVVDLGEGALGGLHQGDAVLGVLLGGLQAGDLGPHLLADGQTGGVVAGAVDLVAGGELLQVLGQSGSIGGVVAVGVHRHDIVLDPHFNCILSI